MIMNEMPRDPEAISSVVRAARDDVLARLRDATEQYRRSDDERRQLMVTAADLGLSIRQIAAVTGDGHSSVATWIKRTRTGRGPRVENGHPADL
ncbi:hypothetical protein DEI93_03330 [Curtobacterium sp. MCBD17_035]|uniref:hypothetical protein n=1 Tax=Curtobacterium sp. MCBD17_035 TaxID=2175673 RepID=UPI000DA9E82F|nr:hypothetical protein [Curtobacterium sp. MCBD17_035]WIB68090.1 hypothetical protein DEI93_03330 [Curtobacterium sp. MCBD17_035]